MILPRVMVDGHTLWLINLASRFPAPPYRAGPDNFRMACMREIEAQAVHEWRPSSGYPAMAVQDFDRIVIPPVDPEPPINTHQMFKLEEGEVFMSTTTTSFTSVAGNHRDDGRGRGRTDQHRQHGQHHQHRSGELGQA